MFYLCKTNNFDHTFFIMKSERYFILIVFVLLTAVCSGQTLRDVLYMKNGSKVVGTILEQQPGSSIKFKDLKGNVYIFTLSEIDRMARETAEEEKEKKAFVFDDVRNSKWYVSFHAGYCAASVEYREQYYDYFGFQGKYVSAWRHLGVVQAGAGYRINRQATVGLNVGALINDRVRLLPIMAEGTYSFLKKRVSPYVNAAAGYSLGFRDPKEKYPLAGGASAAARLGIKCFVVKELAIMVDVGYRGQQRFMYFPSKWFHGMELRAGFIF